MKEPSRFLSLQEAKTLLPLLEEKISHILRKKTTYHKHQDELLIHELLLRAEQKSENSLPIEEAARHLENLMEELEKEVQAIRQIGAFLHKGSEDCLDLPGLWQGREVYFCWRQGESQIQHYHAPKESERFPLKG